MFIIFLKRILLIFITIIFTTNVLANDKMKLGLEVFNNKANCGTCHILKDASSLGNIGPNLDELKPSLERIVYTVTNGIGLMQAWEGILTYDEIDAVAYFVFNSTNK